MLVGCVVQNLYMPYLLGLASGDKLNGLDIEVEWHYRSSSYHHVYDWLDCSCHAAYHTSFYGTSAFILFVTGNLLSKSSVVIELGSPVFHEQTSSLTIYLVVTKVFIAWTNKLD